MTDAAESAVDRGVESVSGALTPSALIQLDYIAPPPDLAPYVTTFYLFRCDEPLIRDIQPAATGQLYVYLAGEGHMTFADGRTEPGHPVTLLGPLTTAASFVVNGPFHAVGAVLGPLGWGAFTGIDAALGADRQLDAAQVFGPAATALGDAVCEAYRADPATDGARLTEPIAAFIRARLREVPPRHAELVAATVAWLGSALDPPIAALYASSAYSPRQIQRLVARYFGSSPAHLVRKYRATRVAALLSQPEVDDATVAWLTDQFYDQSHMIREIREFVGRTPRRLGDGDSPINHAIVNVRNFYQIKPHAKPMADLAKDARDA